MNPELHSRIADDVLKKIRGGDVQMRSRAYFVARVVLSVVVALVTLFISVSIVSFVLFSVRASGQLFLLGYGAHGVQAFLALFPWAFLMLDIALILFLQWLLQGFKFGYRASLLTVFLSVLLGSLVLGAAFNLVPLHAGLLQRAERGQLPVFGGMYQGIRTSHRAQGVFRGVVVSSSGPTSTIMHNDKDTDTDDGTHTVVTASSTRIDAPLEAGDRVYIFGFQQGGVIEAEGIRHLPDEE